MNKKIQLGTMRISAFWNEKENGRGYYFVNITKSDKDKDGNWRENTIKLPLPDLLVLRDLIGRMADELIKPEEFAARPRTQQIDTTAIPDEIDF